MREVFEQCVREGVQWLRLLVEVTGALTVALGIGVAGSRFTAALLSRRGGGGGGGGGGLVFFAGGQAHVLLQDGEDFELQATWRGNNCCLANAKCCACWQMASRQRG